MINSINPEIKNKQQLQQVPVDAGQNFSAQNNLNRKEIKEKVQEKAADNFIGKAAGAGKELGFWTYTKNFALCILMSLGFTHGTNWLITSKDMTNRTTNAEDFVNTRMFKLGENVDKCIAGNPVGKAISSGFSNIKSLICKIPVPKFIKEIGSKIKMGTRSQWDKTGNYTIGKGGEAMNEAIEFLSSVPREEIKRLGLSAENQNKILSLLKKYDKGLMSGDNVYKEISHIIDKIPSAKLLLLSTGPLGLLNKLFRTKPNINMAFHKAKIFNGGNFYNARGPISKGFQKLSALVGEASGGGTLGGGMALLMNSVGLMTAFNAASEAPKGEKVSAFMEDYIGYTLGSYLMSFVVGKCMHRALGIAELGLDPKAIEAVGKKMGINTSRNCLNDVVIAHNKMFTRSLALEEALNGLSTGKMPLKEALNKVRNCKLENINPNITKSELENILRKELKEGKTLAELADIAKDIKAAYKSKLTLKSIFKADQFNKGNFLQRLGRYVTQKPLSIIGKIAATGKYDLFSNSGRIIRTLKWAKRFGGGLGRILLVLTVLTPPFAKLFGKISHAIFGRPHKSKFDEEKKPSKNEMQKQQIEQILAPTKPDGTNDLGMTQEEVNLLKSKGLKDEEIIQAGMYIKAQKEQIKQLLETTDKNGINAAGLTKQEMKALRDKGLKDLEILQVAAYKKQQESQIKRNQEIANAPAVPSNNLLKKPIASSSLKGYQASSAPNRRYVPSSRCNVKPASVPENLLRDMKVADVNIQNAQEILNGKLND